VSSVWIGGWLAEGKAELAIAPIAKKNQKIKFHSSNTFAISSEKEVHH
jgi:hypothetical protein